MGNTEKNTKAKKTKEIAQADAPVKDVPAETVRLTARIRAENMVKISRQKALNKVIQ